MNVCGRRKRKSLKFKRKYIFGGKYLHTKKSIDRIKGINDDIIYVIHNIFFSGFSFIGKKSFMTLVRQSVSLSGILTNLRFLQKKFSFAFFTEKITKIWKIFTQQIS